MSYEQQQAVAVLGQLSTAMEGLISKPGWRPPVHPLQQGAMVAGGAPDLHCCAGIPTHCFRTVSQRSFSTPTRFVGENAIPLPPGTDILNELLFNAAAAVLNGIAPNGNGLIFNDANVQQQRQRIYELVLIGIRAQVDITLLDDTPAVTQSALDLSGMARNLAALVEEYLTLRIYHTADRNDPWMDDTPLAYFHRENDEFLPVPPVRWIDRDPAFELRAQGAEFNGGVFQANPLLRIFPEQNTGIHTMIGQCSITVEALFIPDPDVCGDYWPGELCPADMVGNKPTYAGPAIPTAKKAGGVPISRMG